MSLIDDLHKKYQLSDDDIDFLRETIINDYTAGVKPEKKPKAVILGGQPGAGKSELTIVAQKIIGKNSVICNADEYRDYHPASDEIKRLHENYYPEITVRYSQPWNNQLRSYCEENRLNYILETTFSSGKLMNRTIQEIKNKGYEVYILVLSVNKRLSFLGTRLRYEEMKGRDGYGRLVPKEIHDGKYEDVFKTLEIVAGAKLYDKIIIIGRAGRQKQKGMHNGLIVISENSDTPIDDYINEKEKEWSDNDMRFFNSDVLYLIRMMVERKADYEDIKYVLDVFEVGLQDIE